MIIQLNDDWLDQHFGCKTRIRWLALPHRPADISKRRGIDSKNACTIHHNWITIDWDHSRISNRMTRLLLCISIGGAHRKNGLYNSIQLEPDRLKSCLTWNLNRGLVSSQPTIVFCKDSYPRWMSSYTIIQYNWNKIVSTVRSLKYWIAAGSRDMLSLSLYIPSGWRHPRIMESPLITDRLKVQQSIGKHFSKFDAWR